MEVDGQMMLDSGVSLITFRRNICWRRLCFTCFKHQKWKPDLFEGSDLQTLYIYI